MSNNICVLCKVPNSEIEVTKQRCGHIICWKCVNEYVEKNLAPKIKCPSPGCGKNLSDNAIRKVLSDEDTERYEQLSTGMIPQRIKCLLPGCDNIFICTDANIQFECSHCSLFNCVPCKAAHRCLTCEQYRTNEEARNICQTEVNKAMRKMKVLNRDRSREMFLGIDASDLMIYDNLLECPNCCRHLAKGDGVTLRCSHLFCRYCLSDHIKNSSKIPITCPSVDCNIPLEEREIRTLIGDNEIGLYIDRCNSIAKGKLDFTFQCQRPDCVYFVTYSTKPDVIVCGLCKSVNCTKCFAIHTNETCEQFKERIKSTPYGQNLLAIEEKIRNKELMRCLKCHQLLQKIKGCSWIQCSNCNFEMCWALQMRRWGPQGRGDESDGCKCRLFGPHCAPDCGSCEPHHNEGDPGTVVSAEEFHRLIAMLLFSRLQDLLRQ